MKCFSSYLSSFDTLFNAHSYTPHISYSFLIFFFPVQLQQSKVTPDVILTDVMMPEMSGIELANRLRDGTMPQYDVVPIVMLTAKADDRLRIQMLHGMYYYVNTHCEYTCLRKFAPTKS